MTMTPDALPILSKGHYVPGSGKACAMDAVSWLSGRPEEGDAPSCVFPLLRGAFIRVNDALPDDERHKLWPLIARAMGTSPTGLDRLAERVLNVRLAAWCARQSADAYAYAYADARLQLLEGLITEYERLTGHTAQAVPADRLATLAVTVGVA